MRYRRILVGTVTVAALGGVGLAVVPGTATGASPGQPVLATGTLTFPAGASTGQVLVFADPNQRTVHKTPDGDSLTVPLVTAANVASDGAFTLTLDPATLPANTLQPDGSVNLEAIAVSGGRQQVFFFPAALAQTSTGATAFVSTSTGAKPATPRLRFDLRGGSATNTQYQAGKWLAASGRQLPAAEVQSLNAADTTVAVKPDTAAIAAAVAASGTSTAASCHLVVGSYIKGVPEHFVNAYTDDNDAATVHVTESTTATHTLGVAVDVGGTWHQSGTASISKTDGVSSTSADRQKSWSYWNKVNYRKYFDSCLGAYQRAIGFYDILEASHGGPVKMLWLSASCGVHDAGSKWHTEDATAATFGTGVDLPVLKVSAQTGFGSDERIYYTFDHKAEIVGNDGLGPTQSSKVEADTSWRVCVQP
jgi:hypothetical protein